MRANYLKKNSMQRNLIKSPLMDQFRTVFKGGVFTQRGRRRSAKHEISRTFSPTNCLYAMGQTHGGTESPEMSGKGDSDQQRH